MNCNKYSYFTLSWLNQYWHLVEVVSCLVSKYWWSSSQYSKEFFECWIFETRFPSCILKKTYWQRFQVLLLWPWKQKKSFLSLSCFSVSSSASRLIRPHWTRWNRIFCLNLKNLRFMKTRKISKYQDFIFNCTRNKTIDLSTSETYIGLMLKMLFRNRSNIFVLPLQWNFQLLE